MSQKHAQDAKLEAERQRTTHADTEAASMKTALMKLQKDNEAAQEKHSVHISALKARSEEMDTDNEKAKVNYEHLNAEFRGSVTEISNLRADLRRAEKDAEENETGWRDWYEDLSEGVDQCRSGIHLWGHLCDKLSRTHVASHIPGMTVTNAEIAEAAKTKDCCWKKKRNVRNYGRA